MYSRFVEILKFFQLLGYIGALIIAFFYAKLASFEKFSDLLMF